ncbi:MAG TPA: DNA polymerase domain-containing protein [bacterium]|nr:DNA polymerase domain-containing protein [bacterium]
MNETKTKNIVLPAETDRIIYGANPLQKVVGFTISGKSATTYIRQGDTVMKRLFPCRYFFILSDVRYADGIDDSLEYQEFDGPGHFRHAYYFRSGSELWRSLKTVVANYNRINGTKFSTKEVFRIPDILFIADRETQFLVESGIGQFKGMDFSELRRMQIAVTVATPCELEYTRASHPDNRILCISLSDNTGWHRTMHAGETLEEDMLNEVMKAVSERDPDVIEGHDLFVSILPLLYAKCRRHKISFRLGRDFHEVESFKSIRTVHGKRVLFVNYHAPGRHLVDTLSLADKTGRVEPDTDNYDACAVANDVVGEKQFETGRDWYSAHNWGFDWNKIVSETENQLEAISVISETVLPADFYQSQMVPVPLGKMSNSGQARKIELMMMREYIHSRQAIPVPPESNPFEGGYNEIFVTGKCDNVAKVDVVSQYPSIILGEKISPESDSLGVFLPMLEELVKLRKDARSKKSVSEGSEKIRNDNLQKSLKLLCNAAYGMLGHRYSHFADFNVAAEVTAKGREFMKSIIAALEKEDCQPIQADTDGCYFSLPGGNGDDTGATLSHIRDAVNETLPGYAEISIEGIWPSMLSLKKKNYALLSDEGTVRITGGLLGNRGDEKFIRDILRSAAHTILNDDLGQLHDSVADFRDMLKARRLPVSEFVLFENVTMERKAYQEATENGGGKIPLYEKLLRYEGDRVFRLGSPVGYYHISEADALDDTGIEFDFHYHTRLLPEDTGHYIKKLDSAFQRLRFLFTPEQFKLVFQSPVTEVSRKAAQNISAAIINNEKLPPEKLKRYVELSRGFKSKKGIRRHVFIEADDMGALQAFREKYSDTDVYRSTYAYLCDRLPDKHVTRFCPKSGDFIIELESETGNHEKSVGASLSAARNCVETIEKHLKIPHTAVKPSYNGGKSIYLSIPQNIFGVPDCVELNVIYERIAGHILKKMSEEYRDAVDMNLYNHDRPLRIPGSVHPSTGLYNVPLTISELFSCDVGQIMKYAKYQRDLGSLSFDCPECPETHDIVAGITKDIPRTVHFDPSRKMQRTNMRNKNWRKNIATYLRDLGVPVQIPCVEALSALIQSGGSIGFNGRVKLVTELRAAGSTEEEIIRVFMDSPFFFEKYFGDIVFADTRSESQRNDTGYMLRGDIWNDYNEISCAKCQEWCNPASCYRNHQIAFFDENNSPSFQEFRDGARKSLESALDDIFRTEFIERGFLKVNLVEAPMASGKTYQAVSTALDLAEDGKSSLILEPDHTTCAEAVDMASRMGKNGSSILVHLMGKNEISCADFFEMIRPCASCRMGISAFNKKHPDYISEFITRETGVFSVEKMKTLVAHINNALGKHSICLRTLSMMLASRAHVVVAPFVFLIDRNLRQAIEPLRSNIFIDEADLFADQLMNRCRRSLTVALPRTSSTNWMRFCRKPRCGQCKLSYSSHFCDGDMEPKQRAFNQSAFNDPGDFINSLKDAAMAVREEMSRGVIRNDIFDLDAVNENIERIEHLLKPAKHYFRSHEKKITVEEHLRRENALLCSAPSSVHDVIETGPIFGFANEITRYPSVKLKKVLIETEELQFDEEPPSDSENGKFRFSVSSIYTSKESYRHYRQADPAYRNNINMFLSFLEFCENAPNSGALLRHIPRTSETEAACRIVLSYLDREQFENTVMNVRLKNNALLSGTFITPGMAAATLLLDEREINYFNTDVNMHNLATLILHNNRMGEILLSGNRRDNPAKPKALNHNSFFTFFNYCIDLSDDDLNLYYFAKNKNMAKSLFDSYKRHSGGMKFKAHLLDSNDNVICFLGDELLFHPQAPAEMRNHLERSSFMFVDNYRSSRSRGKNLPDFHLSVADGNGRANFDHFFDYVVAINTVTGLGITLGELLNYNRNRAVCQAMLRTPRDDSRKHLIVYNGDMTIFDVPGYLKNRIVGANDLYKDYWDGSRRRIFKNLRSEFSPGNHEDAQMLMLASYFMEMTGHDSTTEIKFWKDIDDTAPDEDDDASESKTTFMNAARICPAFSERTAEHIFSQLSEKKVVTHADRVGRKTDWLALLDHLVSVGLIVKEKHGRKVIYLPSDELALKVR